MKTTILKSDVLPSLLGNLTNTTSSGIENEIFWPVSQSSLLQFFFSSAEHSRCCQIKAEGAFGNGVVGDKSEVIEELCLTGSADLFTQIGLDLEIYGNGFLEIIRAGSKIIGLSYLPAITMYRKNNLIDFVQKIVKPDGLEVFNHFDETEVIHFRHADSAGGYYSLPMWYGGSDMIELLNAATAWNKTFFEQNAMPTYAIITKGKPLNDAEMLAVQEVFRNDYKGLDNAHKTLLLHVGDTDAEIEFKQLTSSIKDGDFLKLLDAATGRITIAHGVPPRLLG
ncbi:MAG: phage portal protein, partial [Methylococcales bacterium]|nr:phage portal protein [Methylococcales bacterium]